MGGSGLPGVFVPFPGEEGDRAALATWASFEVLFRSARLAKYGELPGSSLAPAKQVEGGRYLQGLASRGLELATARGVPMERGDISAALSVELLTRWFAHEGRQRPEDEKPYLVQKKHPLWALYGDDLIAFGDAAIEHWAKKIKPPKPKIPEPLPPSAEVRAAIREAAVQFRTTVVEPAQVTPVAAPITGDRFLLASIHEAMEKRAALAPSLPVAKVPSPEAFPETAPELVLEESPAASPPVEETPRKPFESTEATAGETTGQKAPQETAETPRPFRLRRPGSRPFTGTTSAPGVRPDGWRYMARPDIRPVVDDDDPPDE